MKRVFARIGMYLTVSDEEFEELKEEYYGQEDLPKELCERFLKDGELSSYWDKCTDSYIPDSAFDDRESYSIEID